MNVEKIVSIAKRRGIIWPSSEIYGGLSGFFDYGPVGFLLKRNILDFWREFFVESEDNIFEIDTSLVLHEKVWDASGHLKDFVDPLVECKNCKKFFRADHLIEEKTGKFVEGLKAKELDEIIQKENIKCPECGGELDKVKIFNLMSKTFVGPLEKNVAYLRPETAQGIFINFKNILNATRAKLPFGIAQIGLSFRNEISPRQWVVRLRQFNQMEIEMFFDPKDERCNRFEKIAQVKVRILTREAQKKEKDEVEEVTVKEAVEKGILPNKWIGYFLAKETIWYQKLGIPFEALRHRHMLPEETPHYSKGNFDLEIKFDFGWKETVGNAYRTDFDLKTHMKHAKVDFHVVENGRKIVPHVVEPSFGLERTIYAVLLYNFVEDKERGWDWFKFPARIAPFKAGIFPLVSKDGLPEKAKEVYQKIKGCFDVFYDEKGSIGKRYARADEIGVPIGITIDYQTLKDNTVTLRDRDTTKQMRVKIEDISTILWKIVKEEKTFSEIFSHL